MFHLCIWFSFSHSAVFFFSLQPEMNTVEEKVHYTSWEREVKKSRERKNWYSQRANEMSFGIWQAESCNSTYFGSFYQESVLVHMLWIWQNSFTIIVIANVTTLQLPSKCTLVAHIAFMRASKCSNAGCHCYIVYLDPDSLMSPVGSKPKVEHHGKMLATKRRIHLCQLD